MKITKGRAGVALALMMSAGPALAQESFTVGGPLDVFIDLSTSEQYYDYTWTAEVTYNPDGATMELYENTDFDQSFFYDSILTIEYSIYAPDASLVVSGVEIGHVGNVVSALNDKNPDDATHDQVYWYGDDPHSATRTRAGVGFSDETGTMVDAVDVYPSPPQWGDFDFGGGEFYQYTPDSGEGFKAWGRIKAVSAVDPVDNCREGAKNHGQFVRCAVHALNELRKNGEITGREKGQWLNMLDRFEELKGQARNWNERKAGGADSED